MVKQTGKKQKKIKDPNRPKRAMSAFFIFQNEARPKLKAQRPDLKATEIVKHLSASWNEMTDEQKDPFRALDEEDKARWKRESENYVPPPNLKTSSGRKKKDPNEPKKALTAFIFFSNHMRPNIKESCPDLTIPEIGKRLGVLWKEMNEEDREPYRALEREDKVRHTVQKKEYLEKKQAEAVGLEEEQYVNDHDEHDFNTGPY